MQLVAALYVAHAEAVRDKLRSMGIHGPDLEDLLQETFKTAARRCAKLPKNVEEAKAWLLETARKLAANWRRLLRHSFETFGLPEVIDRAIAEPEDPEAAYMARDLVRCALRCLSPEDRDVLVSHDVDGESLAELAARLDVKKSAVHVRVQVARARCRAHITRLRARERHSMRAKRRTAGERRNALQSLNDLENVHERRGGPAQPVILTAEKRETRPKRRGRPTSQILLTEEETRTLKHWTETRNTPQGTRFTRRDHSRL